MTYIINIDYNFNSKRIELDGIVSYETFLSICNDMFNDFPDPKEIEISYSKSNIIHYIDSNESLQDALNLFHKNEIEMLNLLISDLSGDGGEVIERSINNSEDNNDKGFIASFEEKWKELTDQVSDVVDSLDEKFQRFKDSIEAKVKAIISELADHIFIPLIKDAKIKMDELKRHIQNICIALIEKAKPEFISSNNQIEYKEIDTKNDVFEDTHISLVLSDLNILREMGFTDEKQNLELLAKYPNDLDSVINELVNGES